jgi:uncharacterized membrane protein
MNIADVAKGKWLKHPLHPIVVHAPVGLWPSALIFDCLSRIGLGGNAIVQLSFFSITAGLLAALIAIPTGVLDWGEVRKERPAWKLGLYHMAVNLVVALIYAINLGLRIEDFRSAETVAAAPWALSGIGTVLLFLGAYLGGLMVYDQGVGVARMSKDNLRNEAERAGANVPKAK